MDNIKVTFRKIFLADSVLASLIGENVYPKHLSSIKNPTYPCITISFEKIMSEKNEFEESGYYIFDVWGKRGNDELMAIYSRVKALINKKRSLPGIVYCIQYHCQDDLYEDDTHTFHLCAKYKVTTLDVTA
jgi:hypothetical protein